MTDILQDELLFTGPEPLFADDSPDASREAVQGASSGPGHDGAPDATATAWKVIIADDDEEVHALTKLVLGGYEFEERGLEFLHAYSGREAVDLLRRHEDVALLLLDVVMETETAGLDAVRVIRDDLDNHTVRIVLRTGQPGQAPENEVVNRYDINDYKSKTELTAQKLYTTVTAALRSYRDLRTIAEQREGLELINIASVRLFEHLDPGTFPGEVLSALRTLLTLGTGDPDATVSAVLCDKTRSGVVVTAAMGRYEGGRGRLLDEVLDAGLLEVAKQVCELRFERILDSAYISYLSSRCGREGLVLLESDRSFTPLQSALLETYGANLKVAYDNIHLNQEILETQREMIYTLGEVVESRSLETACHVKRVGQFAGLLGGLAGLDEETVAILRMAAPLHDVGKIAVPDAILNKAGKLTSQERIIMETHARIGHQILSKSGRRIFQAAAIVAHQHHERWDGKGYPRGLREEEIHVFGRIVALADVFDALYHERVYKPAFPLERCLEILRRERGEHFDPRLTDLFLDNVELFLAEMEETACNHPAEIRPDPAPALSG